MDDDVEADGKSNVAQHKTQCDGLARPVIAEGDVDTTTYLTKLEFRVYTGLPGVPPIIMATGIPVQTHMN